MYSADINKNMGVRLLDPVLLKKNISETARKNTESGLISGCSVLVNQEGRELLAESYGYADPVKELPMDGSIIFRLASMTKPVTAVAALLLYGSGMLRPTDPVSEYFPKLGKLRVAELDSDGNIVNLRNPERGITLYDLLTHTSGFGSDALGGLITDRMPQDAKKDLFTAVEYYGEEMCLSFSPGTRRSYSPVAAFDVVAAICSLASGREFSELVTESILSPLGMKDTVFEPSAEQRTRFCGLYEFRDGKRLCENPDFIFGDFPLSYHAGGAGLAGTARDYSAFAGMLLGSAVGEATPVLTKELLRMMLEYPTVESDAAEQPGEVFGSGVRVIIGNSVLPRGSFGWSGAYGTHFWVDPQNRITAVYMKNALTDGGAGCITACEFERDVMRSMR